MSIDEEGGGSPGFERTPPHNMEAEQSVLGGMLLSKDAIADVVEILRSDDFYRPAHQMVYDVITDLYGRGEPADAVTVFDELQKRGEMARVGGAAYLHTLTSVVPTAANAGYYAKIVREQAILRRLIEAGTRIVTYGYGGQNEEVDDLVDRAQAEIYKVTERRTSEDYAPLADIMPGALDELEAIGSRGGQMVGVPTGFQDLDALTNGLHPGQMIVVAARPAIGKALALDTPLPTPTGWTTMGEVEVGDQLIGADGRPTRVVAATGVMHGRPCHEVAFDDGTVIVADAQHQWRTTADGVVTTEALAAVLRAGDRPAVAVAAAFDLAERDLPVAPYALGVDLAGGADTNDAAYGARHGRVATLTRRRIPATYLRASRQQRSMLLAGLLEVAGRVGPDGLTRLVLDDRELAGDALELVLSLGHQATLRGSVAGHVIVFAVSGEVATNARVRHVVDVRPVASRPVRCVEVDNADHMYLAGRSCVPTHNSTLGLDFARSAAIKHGMTTVIFSLEMSRNEITMRLLSAEARVALHHMRSGVMSDDDWTRLARRMSEVAEAPLFIDDSPNMSMMEIRAKCRRLKQRNDLRFVIIDYLQLMSSPKKTESRQNEVSEISRAIKLLAKELEVPVIAISQLNRGPEQRTDKRPQVSDLRESGCLTADTRILRADTGAEVSLGELLASGARDIPVWSLDDRLRLVPRTMTHVFPSGTKEVFKLRLTSGREITATANHPFMTYDGWRPLGEIGAGTRLAVPRHVPAPQNLQEWPEEEVILLAHLIGDGSFVRRQPIRYASKDEACLEAVTKAATHFGVTAVRDEYAAARVTTLRLPAPYQLTHGRRNPIAAWLDGLGLFGLRSHEKFVPEGIFALPKQQVALFLRHLWATDGCVWWDEKQNQARIYYASTSRRLVDDVARLLLRFNVMARIKTTQKGNHRPGYHLYIYGSENQLRFLETIGVHGQRADHAARCMPALLAAKSNTNLDTVPREVWDHVRDVLAEKGMSHRAFSAELGTQFCGSTLWKHAPSRARLGRVAAILDDAQMEMLATNDVFWDEVASIASLGEQSVYDATVLGTHNFVANGISVHNSIEQDADMVILLHREDAYERESPRAGEADLLIAKHRNGPTGTVTVAFQGHYSRFVDMAQH
ncbi:replicative DNA helicase [Nonomuraea maritima]|uniref:Replicative DNA helicase n=1 Tax=Nonomuraea maritima TaxID=683260 RepID=A0A1G9KWZ8_9ACTN|nr:replicative DNA helicase [Nonomuraea maritima]